MSKRIQRRTAGPGRPRKYGEDLKRFQAPIPESTYDKLYELKEKLGISFAELLSWLLEHAKWELLELKAKIKHLEEYIKQLEKEKQALLEELERERQAREKAEKEAEYWKQQYYELKDKMKGKAAVSSRSTKIINALVKVIEEGKTWSECMSEIGIEFPEEQKGLLEKMFVIHDEYGNIADVFYPLKTLRKLQGWVLVKGKESGIVNYVFTREDTLKVAQQLKKANAKKTKVKRVVSPEKAKQEIEQKLSTWVRIYERDLLEGRTKAAMEYLLTVQNEGLRKLIKEYNFELVEEVVFSNSKFAELFGNSLASLKKKAILEVEA